MKMYTFIMIQVMFFSLIGCNEEEQEQFNCQDSCSNEYIIEIYTNIKGKVFINNFYITENSDTNYIYAITISNKDLNYSNWTIYPDSILVPCNLPNEFKINNQKIIVSGLKKSCCQLLAHPNFRGGYGCKFEITKIDKF